MLLARKAGNLLQGFTKFRIISLHPVIEINLHLLGGQGIKQTPIVNIQLDKDLVDFLDFFQCLDLITLSPTPKRNSTSNQRTGVLSQ